MFLSLSLPTVIQMTMQRSPDELGINYLPLAENGLNLALSPTMLGETPRLVLRDKAKIDILLTFLRKTRTNRDISKQFIHFIFRFKDGVIYVDCDGIVQGVGGNFCVDPKILEKMILDMGYPPGKSAEAIPSDWQ